MNVQLPDEKSVVNFFYDLVITHHTSLAFHRKRLPVAGEAEPRLCRRLFACGTGCYADDAQAVSAYPRCEVDGGQAGDHTDDTGA